MLCGKDNIMKSNADSRKKLSSSYNALDRRTRRGLARKTMRALDGWGLTESEQAAALGMVGARRAALGSYRRGCPLPNDAELLERAGHLLALQRAVRHFYRDTPGLASAWMTRHSMRFGARPIDLIAEQGIAALRHLRADLEPDPARKAYAGCGNVFEDLGLPHPELLAARATLLHALDGVISERGLTKAQAAKLCGIEPQHFSWALRGVLRKVTLDTLVRWLAAMGYEVTMAVGKTRTGRVKE